MEAGAALYAKEPTAAEAAEWGMTIEEASPPVGVWPDNMPTVSVFIAMSTQWRVGMNGPIGLDYTALSHVMRMTGVRRPEWPYVFDGVRIMESAALEEMRKK